MAKLNLALIAGGISSEREVSLSSGDQVYAALDKSKYTIHRYDPQSDLKQLVADAEGLDVALIILHGPYGEDGTVQGLLDLLGIPYQGAGVLGSALAMNKLVTKQLYAAAGLPTAAHVILQAGQPAEESDVVARLGLPVVIKPVEAGSSIGMAIVEQQSDLGPALETAFSHGDTVMVEAYKKGIEITAGVLGNAELTALPLIEIIPDKSHTFFDYTAKYTAGVTEEICPARISEALTEKAQSYALAAHRALQLSGYSRTDMILVEDEFYLLETNTIPGMTGTSLFPQAAAKAGLPFSELLDRLIELGIEAKRKQ
ncbi:MAG: D-alanine--D-alanine ligase [Desulfosarcinaceae bacterium]|nr:D-alanine--D-alanine ligase [Desulfosarcinaceae bacterium]